MPSKDIKKIVYIGRDFYFRSSTSMSDTYLIGINGKPETYTRYDWGLAECDLENRYTLNIRPATPKELDYFHKKCDKIKSDLDKIDAEFK